MNAIFDELRKIRTPIIYDAIERFDLRPRNEGYMDRSIKCVLPSLGPMIGYACTGKVVAELPPAQGERLVEMRDVWRYAQRSPGPKVMAVQDLDQPPRGCAWGDVAASIFLRLDCVGAITNGGVRDIQEVEKLGFHLFAPGPVVGHAYIRWVEFDTPVKVGTLNVYPGDLIHADEHGVTVIPKEIPLEKLLDVIKAFLASEKTLIDYCQQPELDLDTYVQRVADHEKRISTMANE